jgi:hypothetical protein
MSVASLARGNFKTLSHPMGEGAYETASRDLGNRQLAELRPNQSNLLGMQIRLNASRETKRANSSAREPTLAAT